MVQNGIQVIHRSDKVIPYGRPTITSGPFTKSNIEISKSVPELNHIFANGRVDTRSIKRSLDGDEVRIPVALGYNGSARNFTIYLKPISKNQCHIEIKEHFPRSASKTILDDAGISHLNKLDRVAGEETNLISHLRREIQFLTGVQPTQQVAQAPDREIAAQIAKPNNYIQTGGLTIEGSNEKVVRFLSQPNIQVENKNNISKNRLEKLIKLTDLSAQPRESTLKFKLTNPNGKDQAKLTVSDRSGIVLLKDSIIKIEKSTSHQDRSPAVKALYKAVGKLNKQYNTSKAA